MWNKISRPNTGRQNSNVTSIHINRVASIHLDLCDVTELSPNSGKLFCDDILVN